MGKKIKYLNILVFSYTTYLLLSGCIQNLKTLATLAGEKSVLNFYEKERTMDK